MGSLRKARKRAQSKANSKARAASRKVQQGGRFASASDNLKNKTRTAELQGESHVEVLDAKGNIQRFSVQDAKALIKADELKAQVAEHKERNIADPSANKGFGNKRQQQLNEIKKQREDAINRQKFTGTFDQKGVIPDGSGSSGFRKAQGLDSQVKKNNELSKLNSLKNKL